MRNACALRILVLTLGLAGSACGESFGSATASAGGASSGGGSGGAGDVSQPMCADWYYADDAEFGGGVTSLGQWGRRLAGSAVFSLDAKTTEGWSVSLVSGDLPTPDVLRDGGALSDLAIGDQIEVVVQQDFGSFGGHTWSEIVRSAKDHALIAVNFVDYAQNVPSFAERIGVGLKLEPVCVLGPRPDCYEEETQTQFRLLLEADEEAVALDAGTSRPVTIATRPYTARLGVAFENTEGGARRVTSCQDISAFWWRGGVRLSIASRAAGSESEAPR